MRSITEVYFLPAMAIGGVGGSSEPLEDYCWSDNPSVYGGHLTAIEPSLSFEVGGWRHPALSAVASFPLSRRPPDSPGGALFRTLGLCSVT